MKYLAVGFCFSFQALAAFANPDSPCSDASSSVPASGQPIKLGAIVSRTGPDDFSTSAKAAQAYFKCINSAGGIHGRPIEFIVADDRWSEQQAAQSAKDLVESKKVIGFVGSSSFVECNVNAAYYEMMGITSLTGVGVRRACYYSPNIVPVATGPRVSATIAASYLLAQPEVKSMSCIVFGVPSALKRACTGDLAEVKQCEAAKQDAAWLCGGAELVAKKAGKSFSTELIDLSTFSALQEMKRIGASRTDAVLSHLPIGIGMPLLKAAESLGLQNKKLFASSAPLYHPSTPIALGSAWDNKIAVHSEFAAEIATSDEWMLWRKVLTEYGDKGIPQDAFSQAGYLSAKLAVEVLRAIPEKDIDSASFSRQLKKVRNWKNPMLCKPFTIGNGKRHNPNISGPMMSFRGGSFSSLTPCLESQDPELADLKAKR